MISVAFRIQRLWNRTIWTILCRVSEPTAIQRGELTQNEFIEGFNKCLRDKCLSELKSGD